MSMRTLFVLSATLLILNLVDLMMTIMWVDLGLAEEANIIMAHLIKGHYVFFAIIKIALVSLGTYLLISLIRNTFAKIGLLGLVIIYLYIVIRYHMIMTIVIFSSIGVVMVAMILYYMFIHFFCKSGRTRGILGTFPAIISMVMMRMGIISGESFRVFSVIFLILFFLLILLTKKGGSK
jgi:hypothetical protein